MERRRIIFFGSLQTFLKFLLYAGISLLFVVSYHVTLLSASTENYHGKRLNQLGHEQLQKGEAQKALETWEKAYETYRGLNNSEGVSGSLINQSLALQSLGSYPRACETLIEALKLEKQNWICNSQNNITSEKIKNLSTVLEEIPLGQIQIIGLENLGNVLRQIGKTEVSEIVLKKSFSIAKKINNSSMGEILFNLGNTKNSFYRKELSKYKVTYDTFDKQEALESAKINFESALSFYQEAINNRDNFNIKLSAQLNKLELLLLNSEFKISERESKIQDLISQILRSDFKNLPVIESIYGQIKFSKYLIKIASDKKLNYIISDSELSLAISTALSALKEAKKIDNKILESFAFENLAKVSSYLGEFEESKKYLEKALRLAESIKSWDIAYKLQQELGRVYKEIGSLEKAKNAYASAIESVEKFENNYNTSLNSEIRVYFKEKIEPVYQEYMELLLSESQPDFVKILQVKERLQLNEIKFFLRCNHLPLISENKTQQKLVNVTPTIYIFQLKNKVEVIVKTSSGFFENQINNLELVTKSTDNLVNFLQSPYFFNFSEEKLLHYSQDLYKILIKPVEKYLPSKGSLLFVTDTYFQKIPFSVLNNGEKYLLEDYSISVSLRSKNFNQISTPRSLKALIAGIYESNPKFNHPLIGNTFTALPEIKQEILSIEKNITDKIELINSDFTNKNFQKWMRKKENDFPIVHVSSHGQFSSDSWKTFILAWDKPINVRELEYLLINHPNRIELLVLSACQTAKGDKNSGLGIAGVAVMSGAQNTLATLWLVDSKSTSILMGDFYKGLKNGLDESRALRQAQLALAKDPKYSHPYYWAPFILVSR